jgi:hypothetical protein
MKPSETERGRRWLKNFDPDDRPMARRLLDSVRFASTGQIVTSIRDRLIEGVSTGRIRPPVFLVPALSIEDIDAGPPPNLTARHVAFQTYAPNGPISSTPGSEGLIGRIVRDILKYRLLNSHDIIPPTSTLEDLRAGKCRSIVLVTDYVGSGTQLVDFAETFVRHPTLRSWRSGNLLKLHGLTFAATLQAVERVNAPRSPIDQFWNVETVRSLNDPDWSELHRTALERLCVRNAIKGLKHQAMGYKSSGGLFVSDFGVPNNVPAVLRQQAPGWSSFFENRTVPEELVTELGDYRPIRPLSESAAAAGHVRLARNLKEERGRLTGRLMLTALSELNARPLSDEELSSKLNLTVPATERLVGSLCHFGFVTADRNLTAEGIAELKGGNRLQRKVVPTFGGADEPYYPKSMR